MKKDDVVIFSYTRAEAIADGVLIDVSEQAKQAGFLLPGRGHGRGLGRVRRGARRRGRLNETGRLCVLLNMLRVRLPGRGATGSGSISRCMSGTTTATGALSLVHLYALCGPGDDAEPVVTVMLPSED